MSSQKTATNSTFVINNEANPPSYSILFPFEKNPVAKDTTKDSTLSFHKQDPISYNQLFNSHQNLALFQQSIDNTPAQTIALEQLELFVEPNKKKQQEALFPKTYLLKHYIFIVAASLALIGFQIVLMKNNGVLSYIASGLWAGLFNLLTLFASTMALKHRKYWSLVVALVMHVFCILGSLGSLVVINCIAAIRNNTCANYIYDDDFLSGVKCFSVSKNCNIVIIVLGSVCLMMFVTFFLKLISLFNKIKFNND